MDVENMLEALKNSSGANLQGELSHVIRQLQACSLVPGENRVAQKCFPKSCLYIRNAASINCFNSVSCPNLVKPLVRAVLASLALDK